MLFFHEVSADLRPNVLAFDAVVVQHVGRAVDRDAEFLQVGEDVFFRISCAHGVGLDEQEQDALQRPPLRADFDVDPRFCVFFYHVVIEKLSATFVIHARLVGQHLASYHFILELDVGQLAFQLSWVGAFDHLIGWSITSNTRSWVRACG